MSRGWCYIWSVDSDVVAMCPMYCKLLGLEELFFKTGVKQKARYIPMHQVAVNLQQSGMCMALPALHAFSGCDSTSAFFGMGKRRWFDTAATHQELIEGFKGLGNNSSQIDPSTEASYISLVMLMYSRKPHTSLTELRYSLFAIEPKRQ